MSKLNARWFWRFAAKPGHHALSACGHGPDPSKGKVTGLSDRISGDNCAKDAPNRGYRF
jgi:hypothetical protein